VLKALIFLVSAIGLAMKFFFAKAVILSLASVIFTAVVIFKKYSAPHGGTIYVHRNGGASYKSGASWDKEGYGSISQPNRVSKDISGYQGWENYGRGDYSTSATMGDRNHYYSSYYKPNSATYTTTMNPYIT
jgi:hypothetical protein